MANSIIHFPIASHFNPPNPLKTLPSIPLLSPPSPPPRSPRRRHLAVKCTGGAEAPKPSLEEFEKELSIMLSRKGAKVNVMKDGIVFGNLKAMGPDVTVPNLESLMLDRRIIYISYPLVTEVAEDVVAQLLHLTLLDPKATITLYIDSTGTTLGDGTPVALEAEGFGIYDFLMLLDNKIRTVNLGTAMGQACLLLAAGTKGHRYTYRNALAYLRDPQTPTTGQLPASEIFLRAKEAIVHKETFAELLALHTGNSVEDVAKAMHSSLYMNGEEAVKFGLVDKILSKDLSLSDIHKEDEEEEEDDEDENKDGEEYLGQCG
ncbi:ATP-dependent Clp protease proteolytic subunit-related protein [Drosera capensis]